LIGCVGHGALLAAMRRSRVPWSSIVAPAVRHRVASRGVDGGKKIRGSIAEAPQSMIHLGVDKYGIPLAIDISPTNVHDSKGIIPVLRDLSGREFRGSALGDLGFQGKRLAEAGEALGITVKAVARGRDGAFPPAGICWVVERSFA
jgi:hypothetical protein